MDLLSHCSFPLFSTFNAAAKYQANPHTDLSQSKLEFAAFKSEMRAEVKKEVDNGLRDLPSEMVCAYQRYLTSTGRVNYDRITVEFDNSNQPGGGDGTMNIETGVFTTVTSGYYIITFSAYAKVKIFSGTVMSLYHNGVEVEESGYQMFLWAGGSAEDFIWDQGSRSVVRE